MRSTTSIFRGDPATHLFVFGQPLPPHILSHTGYWVDDRFWDGVNKMCKVIAQGHSHSATTGTGTHVGGSMPPGLVPMAQPAAGSAPPVLVPPAADGLVPIAPDPTVPVPYR